MPEIKYFVVQQTREVKVWANSPADAAHVAERAFQGKAPEKVEGKITSQIRDIDLVVRRDR